MSAHGAECDVEREVDAEACPVQCDTERHGPDELPLHRRPVEADTIRMIEKATDATERVLSEIRPRLDHVRSKSRRSTLDS